MSVPGFSTLVVLAIAMMMVIHVVAVMIVGALRVRHEDIWGALGKPSEAFLFVGFTRRSKEMQHYILSGDFRELNDPALARLCNVYRASVAVCVLIVGAAFVAGALSA
ncbi:MAG: hypothetical protein JOZ72_15150 [Alphaproteobacteria bacterium]|nr:hypothetical protein [Alphaproteobacteria bacterium]